MARSDAAQTLRTLDKMAKCFTASALVLTIAFCCAIFTAGLTPVESIPWLVLVFGVFAAACAAWPCALAARDRDWVFAGMAAMLAAFVVGCVMVGIHWLEWV